MMKDLFKWDSLIYKGYKFGILNPLSSLDILSSKQLVIEINNYSGELLFISI